MPSCGVCPTVRPYAVTFMYCIETSRYILELSSSSGSPTILVFPYQTGQQLLWDVSCYSCAISWLVPFSVILNELEWLRAKFPTTQSIARPLCETATAEHLVFFIMSVTEMSPQHVCHFCRFFRNFLHENVLSFWPLWSVIDDRSHPANELLAQ